MARAPICTGPPHSLPGSGGKDRNPPCGRLRRPAGCQSKGAGTPGVDRIRRRKTRRGQEAARRVGTTVTLAWGCEQHGLPNRSDWSQYFEDRELCSKTEWFWPRRKRRAGPRRSAWSTEPDRCWRRGYWSCTEQQPGRTCRGSSTLERHAGNDHENGHAGQIRDRSEPAPKASGKPSLLSLERITSMRLGEWCTWWNTCQKPLACRIRCHQ